MLLMFSELENDVDVNSYLAQISTFGVERLRKFPVILMVVRLLVQKRILRSAIPRQPQNQWTTQIGGVVGRDKPQQNKHYSHLIL